MVSPAQRHRELVADLAPERAALHKAQVMRIAGCPAADEASLHRHAFDVLAVADSAGLGERENAFVDAIRLLICLSSCFH